MDQFGNSALIWSARNDHRVITDLLIAAGANVNLAGQGGLTPVHHSARNAAHGTLGISS